MERWWGKFAFEEGQSRFWEIGPMRLWIQRGETDWEVCVDRVDKPLSTNLQVAVEGVSHPEKTVETVRLGFRRTDSELILLPAPPDRPVVVKSENPFLVSPQQETTIFLSVPLWTQIRSRPEGVSLYDQPSSRPSDTWFGPDTLTGELCYGMRTRALLELEGVPIRPHRALCRVRIRNQAPTPLPLEKLRIPAQSLGLFLGEEGRLWTNAVTLTRDADGDFAQLELSPNAPKRAGQAEKVAGERVKHERRGLRIHSFGSLLGLRGVRYE